MHEIYWTNWEGRDEEPEKICSTLEEAYNYINENSDTCAYDEGYIIFDKMKNLWLY